MTGERHSASPNARTARLARFGAALGGFGLMLVCACGARTPLDFGQRSAANMGGATVIDAGSAGGGGARDAGLDAGSAGGGGARDAGLDAGCSDTRSCAGKCGILDQCGASLDCGVCPQGQTCGVAGEPNVCVEVVCARNCLGKACGADDGCGKPCATGTCDSGLRCDGGVCTCDAGSCNGCCTTGMKCASGTSAAACGANGEECAVCSSVEACAAGKCGPRAPNLVLFGGAVSGAPYSDGDEVIGDTWAFDGAAWREIHVPGPRPRMGHAMATLGDSVVLFGGYADDGMSNDTWVFDGTRWTEVDASGPSARWKAGLATLGDKVVLFGGSDVAELNFPNDTWLFDGARWTPVAGPSPPGRSAPVLATLNGKVVLFGGEAEGDNHYLADTWTFDGSTWKELTDGGKSPTPRAEVGSASLGNELVLFGGFYAIQFRAGFWNDTWAFSGSNWTELSDGASDSPSVREYPAMSALGGEAVLFGGQYSNTLYAETWTFNGTRWNQSAAQGPRGRMVAAMALLP